MMNALTGLFLVAIFQCSYSEAAKSEKKNVLGGDLKVCSTDPMTGWYRTGYCLTDDQDRGTHVVCAVMTDDFLTFTKAQGNDLSTPSGGFPGLKAGDRWCLCAIRWRQAVKGKHAPLVDLSATYKKATTFVPLDLLKIFDVKKSEKLDAEEFL